MKSTLLKPITQQKLLLVNLKSFNISLFISAEVFSAFYLVSKLINFCWIKYSTERAFFLHPLDSFLYLHYILIVIFS
jgi:hypothetical protein